MTNPSAPRVLFIAGLGRSGSTLLERVLGEVPGVVALGEVVHLWERGLMADERCGCGRPFSQCPFWQEVGRTAFGGWGQVDAHRVLALRRRVDRTRFLPRLARARQPEGARKELEEYLSYYRRIYDAAREVAGAELVIDSSKHASLAFCLRHDPAIDLRVVHSVRDSRGVAYSWTKEVQRPEATAGTSLMTRYSPVQSALLWDAHNAALGVLRRLGTPTLRVRYEEFVRQPEDTMRALVRFAGLESQRLEFLTSDEVTLTTGHTVAGNPMRFHVGPLPFRHDTAWRASLPAGQRRLVSALTLPLLLGYGYAHPREGRPVRGPADDRTAEQPSSR